METKMLTKFFFGTVAALAMAVSGVSLTQADSSSSKPAPAGCCKAQDCCQPARACCPSEACCATAERPQSAACCAPQARGDNAKTRRSCCAEQRACCGGSGE